MPRLPRVTADELVRALQRDGWAFVRQHGSHRFFTHPRKAGVAVIPMHTGQTLGPGLLGRILKDAGLTPDELRELL